MMQSSVESQIAEHPHTEEREMNHQSGNLALSAADFSALEERVVRTVKLVKDERQARIAAEQRAGELDAQLQERTALAKSLQEEVSALNAERDQVRQRVERLLSQLDALEV